ncbi:hypothetical protein CEXT_746201 [Caerostris extrusa]|uniref:Uncharacterized protein n=1 Tax=Caerostris extrusa TaxID=172846 RepID=A0AAV4SXU8_CAEEX|nr:hypothetical protein CEXT_746201 [Caerostris extrusa]
MLTNFCNFLNLKYSFGDLRWNETNGGCVFILIICLGNLFFLKKKKRKVRSKGNGVSPLRNRISDRKNPRNLLKSDMKKLHRLPDGQAKMRSFYDQVGCPCCGEPIWMDSKNGP